MWPYVNPDEYEDFAKKLYKRLAPGSIVVLGDIDCFSGGGVYPRSDTFPDKLIESGFKPVERGKSCNGLYCEKAIIYKKE